MSNYQSDPLKALIVEDYEVSSMIIKDMLGAIGVESQIATSKEETLDAVKNQQFQVIFMDIQLGEESGLDVSKEIRKMDIQQPLIIACTANDAITSENDVKEAEMDDLLVKPVSIQAFQSMLDKHNFFNQAIEK